MLKEKIRCLLKQQGKTQKELCAYIGISDTGLRKIFARDSCETALLKKIAQFFDVSVVYFFGESNGNNAVASGDYSAESVHGDATVSTATDVGILQERIKSLQELVNEKERTIKILMNK